MSFMTFVLLILFGNMSWKILETYYYDDFNAIDLEAGDLYFEPDIYLEL
jgi:hypothetical protein